MKCERPFRGIRRPLASDHDEGSSGSGPLATWREIDAMLDVRSRLVFVLDSIECGDGLTAETCLLQLLDDLDATGFLMEQAA
jgi:hypothetical protein